MSGYTDDAIERHGVFDESALVQKPFTLEGLAAAVRARLAGA